MNLADKDEVLTPSGPPRHWTWCRHLPLCGMLLALVAAGPANGQGHDPDPQDSRLARSWNDVALLSVNAMLGGLTAGLMREFNDGSFTEGFATGALGGAVAYSGRRVAVEDFWGAGLIGRQVSGLGASLTRNASQGLPGLSQLYVPVGPAWLQIDAQQRDVRVSVDLYATGWLIAAAKDSRLSFDASSSLSAGAPVFRAGRHDPVGEGARVQGLARAGVIVLGASAGDAVFAHERVHVLQQDVANTWWGYPIETSVGGRVPGLRPVFGIVRLGIAYPLMQSALVGLFNLDVQSRPWEVEARYLGNR